MEEKLMIDEALEENAQEAQEETEEKERIFVIKKRNYRLKFNMRRIQMAEQMVKASTLAILAGSNGMLGIQELMIYFAVGLQELGGDYIKLNKGAKYAEELIQEEGYSVINMLVIEALQRDCGFLFL